MRLVRPVVLCLALAACSNGVTGTSVTPEPPATVPPTTVALPTTTTSTSLPPPTTTLPPAPLAVDHELDLPPDAFVESVAVGPEGVVAAGYTASDGDRFAAMLWTSLDGESWQPVPVGDLFPDRAWVPVVTDVEVFDGRFFAFLMGDTEAGAVEPSVLVSTDGRHWSSSQMSASAGLWVTPESPPYPGRSAVAAATTHDGSVYAVGWATVNAGIVSSLWSSTDGVVWDLTVLPQLSFPNEFATGVSAGRLGLLVNIGGPVHTGVGVLFSADGTDWQAVPVGDRAAVDVGQNEHRLAVLRVDVHGTGKYDLLQSEDGASWTPTPPLVTSDGGFGIRLGWGTTWDPTVYASYDIAQLWTFHRGSWVEMGDLGLERVVAVTEEHVVGVADGGLLFLRRHP